LNNVQYQTRLNTFQSGEMHTQRLKGDPGDWVSQARQYARQLAEVTDSRA